jgi:hypothetical protein
VLGEVFKPLWSGLDTLRIQWAALSPEQQHRQFNSFVKSIQDHYSELHRVSSGIHAKLGKRKHWIESVCKTDGYNPKVKKDESQSFLLAAHFFKKDLSKCHQGIKKVFAPSTYLAGIDQQADKNWADLHPDGEDVVRWSASDFSRDNTGEYFRLWQTWAELFKPVFRKSDAVVVEPQPTATLNIFSTLDASASA